MTVKRAKRSVAAIAAALLTTALASPAAAQASRQVPQTTADTTTRAVQIYRAELARLEPLCEGGDQPACQQHAEIDGVRQRLFDLFEACAGGAQDSCAEHDAIVERIVREADGDAAPAPVGGGKAG